MIELTVPQVAGVLPEPHRLVKLADTVVRVRGEVALAEQRKETMTALASTLVAGGQAATVTARESGGIEWTISIGGSAEPTTT
ncbi:hypothetical protein SK803_42555 [Lentzea sp. BCCO 10_0856]|uniref:Uncharacterized protein n=1 Tax=Lentzea miocenica TaxID=3095431 RepID=A0ABU4TFD3_9PSEU|nr:hypothetical protein [Lentzea sp. BCCO 10_0856]MDX8036919.1 hypothetical protein [Lentzea sp. BCCO 10_0856]